MAMRDANDRAAKLGSPDDAQRALKQALLQSDGTAARAIGAKAYERGWHGVVDQFAQATGVRGFIQMLDETPSGPRTQTADRLAFPVAPPTELRGLSSADLEATANQAVQ